MKGGKIRRARILLAVALFLLSVLVFVFSGTVLAGFASLQFGQALLAFAAGFSTFGLLVIAGTVILTLLFGRVFCSMACPFGVLQDGIRSVLCKKSSVVPNLKALRYGILFLALALLVGGWALGFRFFDPFSRFGTIVSSILALLTGFVVSNEETAYASLGGFATLALIVILVMFKRRLFCVSLCPVGTMLGVFSRYGLFKIRFRDYCTGCGRCQRECPTGCIDAVSRSVDNERCVLCLDCLSLCASNGIRYSQTMFGKRLPTVTSTLDSSKREFLVKGTVALFGVVAAGYGLRGYANYAADADGGILPPGAGDSVRFDRRCTSCHLCVSACPTRIIHPTWFGFGAVRLNYNRGRCEYSCNRCSEICPTGALARLTLEDKQWLRIGEAVLDVPRCRIAATGQPCALCTRACPMGAIFQLDSENLPEVNPYHCIGCGACQAVCPMSPKAIIVKAIESQQAI